MCASTDPCLLLAADTRIVAVAEAAKEMLRLPVDVETARPRFLNAGLSFLDFTADANPLGEAELARLAPIQALQTDALEHGLMRLEQGGSHRTFDVIASPLHSPPQLDAIGSLAFVTAVGL
ncbi:hypothetical protein [Glycomyces xiaoerkulensis]|uniref:hypothetical protein n=1 Tax=Glycomyces xiaoerkulensis TaxID=2038139 RepID=UPI000C255CC1|nr:hypothetical protein [Glycomyces xiaoerkulensis]